MDSDSELVVVKHVTNPATAQLIAQQLRAQGIPALVNGADLQDEFAMSQKLMGALACDVQVPAEWEERAKEALAAAKQAGERMEETGEWREGPDPEHG